MKYSNLQKIIIQSYLLINIKDFSLRSYWHNIFCHRSELNNMFYGCSIYYLSLCLRNCFYFIRLQNTPKTHDLAIPIFQHIENIYSQKFHFNSTKRSNFLKPETLKMHYLLLFINFYQKYSKYTYVLSNLLFTMLKKSNADINFNFPLTAT